MNGTGESSLVSKKYRSLMLAIYMLALASTFDFAMAEDHSKSILNLVIRPNKIEGVPASDTLKNQLLELILEKTKDKYGEFVIKEYSSKIKQSRVISLIKHKETFRVIATMDSVKRRQDIRPIEIPIYKGLLSHRIFIIREEDQPLFSKIKTKEQLQSLSAIQGHDWPDSDILQNAGFKLRRSPNYAGIFNMLRLKRGDYFPRGAHEPWQEVLKHKDKKLSVEKTLLIQYDAPFYFFVNYEDKELYNRIKDGFLLAIKNGSFDRLFYSHPEILRIFKNANLSSRKLFRINNPDFIKHKTYNQDEFWYKMGDEERYWSSEKYRDY